MGLDMYAYKVHPKHLIDPDAQIDLEFKDLPEGVVTEVAYWRKFNQLHGWMERLYLQKGGIEEFNCRRVRLMPADLLQLALDAEAGLPDPLGFFFGNSKWSEEDKEEVLEFCVSADQAITDGYVVFYDSWW
jgi:hypothetical protein